MPYFLNNHFKGNEFELMANDKYFVDKTEMIEKLNNIIGIKDRFVCITRPRRFGKTVNAMMLASYYSKGANFKKLFDKLQISKNSSYSEHLNKHNVVYITFNELPSSDCTYKEFINSYIIDLIEDLKNNFSNIDINYSKTLPKIFKQIYDKTNEGFIFIIDEWDYIFNNKKFTEEDRENFLRFLEGLLKDKAYVELAYMTGVLPIAKYYSGSNPNMFGEYTFLNDNIFDKYFGFTNKEVEILCSKQNKLSMSELREWYNGYKSKNGYELYNPKSVTTALNRGLCENYWTSTGPMEEILDYIDTDIDNIKNDVLSMVADIPLEIHLKQYSSEKKELTNKNQIFSVMTIYGFLSYYNDELRIPNKELKIKFDEALEDKSMGVIAELVSQSNKMLKATINKDIETMERIVQEAHDINIPIIKYNDENSLACVITLVYLNARTKWNRLCRFYIFSK